MAIQQSDIMPIGGVKVLDKGFIALIDKMGDDLAVSNAARVSFGKLSTEFTDKDAKLINYLAQHGHHSPFRHCYLKFHLKAPEFVMRQIYKHVIGIEWTSGGGRFPDSGWNEVSGRYVEYDPEFYIPEKFRPQAVDNKQASIDGDIGDLEIGPPSWDDYSRTDIKTIRDNYESAIDESYSVYLKLLEVGVSKEQARCLLPVCFYTEVYFTCSLQAAAHFVALRNHPGAQWETQQYAQIMESMLLNEFPVSYKALKDIAH